VMGKSVNRRISTEAWANSVGYQSRRTDKTTIRAFHQGHRSVFGPHRQAGHMTASDRHHVTNLLQAGGHPHMSWLGSPSRAAVATLSPTPFFKAFTSTPFSWPAPRLNQKWEQLLCMLQPHETVASDNHVVLVLVVMHEERVAVDM
jgi:hypothetical protein